MDRSIRTSLDAHIQAEEPEPDFYTSPYIEPDEIDPLAYHYFEVIYEGEKAMYWSERVERYVTLPYSKYQHYEWPRI